MKRQTFGINMKRWCREHEARVTAALAQGDATDRLLAVHREKLEILRHERLAHLIVTVMAVFVELFTVDLVLLHPELGLLPAGIMLALAVLLAFYFYHYFFLENTLQRWYVLLEALEQSLPASPVR